MERENSKIDKSQNLESEVSHTSEIPTDFELPQVTEQSQEYHDSEINDIGKNTSFNDSGDESHSQNHDENSGLETSSESPIFMEDEREKSRGIKDDKGKPYDPAMHVFPPEKTPSGIWKKLPKSQREKKDVETGKTILPADTNIKCRRDAEKSAHFYDTIHVMLFGEEGKAKNEQLAALTDSFERFYQENGALNIPPHWELAVTCLDHTTEIVKRPSIFERVQVWGIKLIMKFRGNGGE